MCVWVFWGKYYTVLDDVSLVSLFLQNVMENSDRGVLSSPSLAFTTPIRTLGTPTQSGSTPRVSTMRPLATAYKASTSDYQVISDRQTPKKDESLVSRAMEYMFGW